MALTHCFGLWLNFLVALAAGSGAAPLSAGNAPGSALPKEHRVIVRFSAKGGDDADAHLETQVQKMAAHSGVVWATGLRQVGMIIVACESQEAQEELVEQLDKDPEVELAASDTTVTLGNLRGQQQRPPVAAKGRGLAEGSGRDKQLPTQCFAHPACAAEGLVGDCCPTSDGVQLSCCSAQHLTRVAFRSHHGEYLSVDANGLVKANAAAIDESSTFFVEFLGIGNVTLTTLDGKFLSIGADGRVTASRTVGTASQTFNLSVTENGTVTMLSPWNKYISADAWGNVRATADIVSPREEFYMVDVALPTQRFPDDPYFPFLWGLDDYAGNDIDAPEAWNIWTGDDSEAITVAVIDTGIDYQHEDLQEQMWVNINEIPGNGIDDDGNGFVDDIHGVDFFNEDSDPWDDDSHGTHCAGTLAGRGNNNLGTAGVIWRGVRLMALKFIPARGNGLTTDAIRAIDYAIAHGARILSNSWGGAGSNPQLAWAIARAERAGILFLAAAGNSATDNDKQPQYPASYEAANVVAVASTSPEGALASHSCFGATSVAIAAPGEAIWSTMPGHLGYAEMDGTSMATPHVSGLAALVWTFRPTLSMHQVRDILLESVRKQPWLEGKVATGGMINAKNAIEAARALQPPVPPKNVPAGIQFVDTDVKVGLLGGVVTVTAAKSEADIEYYRVYFVSAAGYIVDPLGDRIPATGAKAYTLQINGSSVPKYATRLGVVAGRTSGEQPVAPEPSAPPSVALKDIGVPELLPKAVVWGGDTDRRPGFVKGILFIDRAPDESTITQYNIYWHNADGTRGEKLGAVPAVGFLEPRCFGRSCARINKTVAGGGVYRFERGPFGPNESATIRASGPMHATLERFDSDQYQEWLSLGKKRVTRAQAEEVPWKAVVPGPLAILWQTGSNSSIRGQGWSIELKQEGSRVGFAVATGWPTPAVEVVPAYMQTELPVGTIVQLVDNDDTTVLGALNETGEHVDAARGTLPILGAPREIGLQQEKVVDAPSATSWFVDAAEGALRTPGALHEIGLQQAPTEKVVEVLQQPPVESPVLAWSADLAEELTASAAAFGHVSCSVTVPGLDAQIAGTVQARHAIERALASALPGVSAASVRVVGVLAVSRSKATLVAPGGRRLAEAVEQALGRHLSAATVEFQVEAPEGAAASAAFLDRVEARLILLSNGGGAAARFDAALGGELRGAGVLPSTVHFDRSRVHEPQRLGPRLVAARHQSTRSRRRLQGAPAEQEKVEEVPGWALLSAVAATAGFAIVAFAALLRRGGARGGRLLETDAEAL